MFEIPGKFYRVHIRTPRARTVGELMQVLSELPDDLPLANPAEYTEGYVVSVYNYGTDTVQLTFDTDDLFEDEVTDLREGEL